MNKLREFEESMNDLRIDLCKSWELLGYLRGMCGESVDYIPIHPTHRDMFVPYYLAGWCRGMNNRETQS